MHRRDQQFILFFVLVVLFTNPAFTGLTVFNDQILVAENSSVEINLPPYFSLQDATFLATESDGVDVIVDGDLLTVRAIEGFLGQRNISVLAATEEQTESRSFSVLVQAGLSPLDQLAANAPTEIQTAVVDEMELLGTAPVIALLEVTKEEFEQNFIHDEFYVEGTEPDPSTDGALVDYLPWINSYKLVLTEQGFEKLATTELTSQIILDEGQSDEEPESSGFGTSGFSIATVQGCGDEIGASVKLTGHVQNISNGTNCLGPGLHITSNSIVLDCDGYNVTGNLSANPAINITGVHNVTVKNCVVTNWGRQAGSSGAILLRNSENSTIFNNTIINNSARSTLFRSGSRYNLIENNSFIDNYVSVELLETSTDNIFSNNSFRFGISNQMRFQGGARRNIIRNNSFTDNPDSVLIFAQGSSSFPVNNLTIRGNRFSNASGAVAFFGSHNNSVIRNRIRRMRDYGFFLDGVRRIRLRRNRFNLSNADIILQEATNDTIIDENVIGNLTIIDSNGTQLINNTIANYSLADQLLTIGNEFGEVTFLDPLTVSGSNFSADVEVTPNSAVVNGSTFQTPANISFFNVTFPAVKILRNGSLCPATVCQNLSYSENKFIFNVTGFSNFTIQEDQPNATCGQVVNQNIQQTGDITCANSGIILNASGITLDCQGFKINGTGLDVGVNMTNVNNVVVKNCEVNNFRINIGSLITENITILNNVMNMSQSAAVWGAFVADQTINANLTNNLVDRPAGQGIFINSGGFATVSNNTVLNGSFTLLHNSTIKDNTFRLITGELTVSADSQFINNTIIDGADNNIIALNNHVLFEENQIHTGINIGIRVPTQGVNVVIKNNNISNIPRTILVDGSFIENVSIVGNTITNFTTTAGSGRSDAIFFAANVVTIANNTITKGDNAIIMRGSTATSGRVGNASLVAGNTVVDANIGLNMTRFINTTIDGNDFVNTTIGLLLNTSNIDIRENNALGVSSFTNLNLNLDSTLATVSYIDGVTATIENLSNGFTLADKFVSVNSSMPGLDGAANITFTNVSFDAIIILRNGTACPSDVCALLVLNQPVAIFNVTTFSNFSVQEGGAADDLCDSGSLTTICTINSLKTISPANDTIEVANLNITSTGEITLTPISGPNSTNVTIIADNVTVLGSINATSAGHQGREDSPNGGTDMTGNADGGGGSYGGEGTTATALGTFAGGQPFGSAFIPDNIGSEGGEAHFLSSIGGAGGGLITIHANRIEVNGTIEANGREGSTASGNGGGGGGGGGIYLNTSTFLGQGRITAIGGSELTGGGAGGGGRIAVHFDSNSFTGIINASAGNRSNAGQLAEGTVVLYKRDTNEFTVPNGTTFRLAEIDRTHTNDYSFNNFTVEELAVLDVENQTEDYDNFTLTVSDIFLMSPNSVLNVRDRGHFGFENNNSGSGQDDRGNEGGAGGGHGGNGEDLGALIGGPSHDDPLFPIAPGGEGGNGHFSSEEGGSGAGVIHIHARILNVSGKINAEGGTPGTASGNHAGGGAGGSVYLNGTLFTGTGVISLGGSSVSTGRGGAGGRLALEFSQDSFQGTFNVSGARLADAGTISRRTKIEFPSDASTAALTYNLSTFSNRTVNTTHNVYGFNESLSISDNTGLLMEIELRPVGGSTGANLSPLVISRSPAGISVNAVDLNNTADNYTLFLPNINNGLGVVVCPFAQSLSEIALECTNAVIFEGSSESNQSVEGRNVFVNVSEGFYRISGVNGTGVGFNAQSNLTIFDHNDTLGGGVVAELFTQINFSANWTNGTSGLPVNGSPDIFCNITISDANIENINMSFLSDVPIYQFNTSFTTLGQKDWNITCASPTYGTLFANDTVNITEILEVNITLVEPIGNINATIGEYFNVTFNVTCVQGNCSTINVSLDPTFQPVQDFNVTFGPATSNTGNDVKVTQDGGYIFVGSAVEGSNSDAFAVKYNRTGGQEWSFVYGEPTDFYSGISVVEAPNGDFVLVGGAADTSSSTTSDGLIIRLNRTGQNVWNNTYAGVGGDGQRILEIINAPGGGFAITGSTDWNPQLGGSTAESDVWAMTIDDDGNVIHNTRFGRTGNFFDWGEGLVTDGENYTLNTRSDSGDGSTSTVSMWVLKLNSTMVMIDNASFGSSDQGYSIATVDGGFVLAGVTFNQGPGSQAMWMIGINETLGHIWNRTYGGPNTDRAMDVIAAGGGTIITGRQNGRQHLLGLNSSGGLEWNQTFGPDYGEQSALDTDGSIAVAGSTDGFDDAIFLKTTTAGKGIISTVSGTLPFWTNKSANPFEIILGPMGSQLVTFFVNATGTIGDTFEFFGFANITKDRSKGQDTVLFNVTIQNITVPDNAPNITVILLNSTFATNRSNENLTVFTNASDLDGDAVKNITVWTVNGLPTTLGSLPFEGGSNSTFTRNYGEGQDGDVFGATYNSSGGFEGLGAYQFDGVDDYINISKPLLEPNKNHTIAAWINPRSIDFMNIFSQNTVSSSLVLFRLRLQDTGRLIMQTRTTANTDDVVFSSDGIISANNWTHIAFTHSTTDGRKIFINGVLDNSTTDSVADGIYTMDMTSIGVLYRNTFDEHFNGTIDELMLLNRTLSPAQIRAIFENRTNNIESNETVTGEIWSAQVTPNDGTEDGITIQSNNLTILNTPGEILAINLNSSEALNETDENLTLQSTTFDFDGDGVKNITTWKLNGSPQIIRSLPFEGGSNTTFTREYALGKNGSVSGATFNITAGHDGRGAYFFDGVNDHINVSDSENMNLLDFTMEIWVNSTNPGAGRQRMLSTQNVGDTAWAYLASFGFRPEFGFYDGSGTAISIVGPDSFNNSQWRHIVGVRDIANDLAILYVDGVAVNTTTDTTGGGVINPNDKLSIGGLVRGTSTTAESYEGFIDDVRIWNRSLTAGQVLALYNTRTDTIVSEETAGGDIWSASITPNDLFEDGITSQSNNITILETALQCGATISSDTTLTSNVINSTGGEVCDIGLTVDTDHVILNCNGFTIRGNGTTSDNEAGILVDDVDNVTVANCTVTQFDHGFFMLDSSNITLLNNIALNNSDTGFVINNIPNIFLRENNVTIAQSGFASDANSDNATYFESTNIVDSTTVGFDLAPDSIFSDKSVNSTGTSVILLRVTAGKANVLIDNITLADIATSTALDLNGVNVTVNNSLVNVSATGIILRGNADVDVEGTIIDTSGIALRYLNGNVATDHNVQNVEIVGASTAVLVAGQSGSNPVRNILLRNATILESTIGIGFGSGENATNATFEDITIRNTPTAMDFVTAINFLLRNAHIDAGTVTVERGNVYTFDNVSISNASTALLVTQASNLAFENGTLANNTVGIILNDTNESLVRFNLFDNNTIAVNITDGTGNNISNNTFRSNPIGLFIDATSTSNNIFFNNFTDSSTDFIISLVAGSSFNTSVGGFPAGNFYGDINSRSIFDSMDDGFGDSGAEYPYNATNNGNVDGFVNDFGPITTQTTLECAQFINEDTVMPTNIVNSTLGSVCAGTGIVMNASNITLDCNGFSIIGNGTGFGVDISFVNGTTVQNCNIQNFRSSILALDAKNTTIRHNNLGNNTLDSVTFQNQTHDGKILNNSGGDNQRHGIAITIFGNNALIANNTMGNVSSFNIVMGNDSIRPTIVDNTLTDGTFAILMSTNVTNVIIQRNTISGMNASGISVQQGGDAVITDNVISDINTSAIVISNSNSAEIRRNTISFGDQHGVFISVNLDTAIIDNNTITNVTGIGIVTFNGTAHTIANNSVNITLQGISVGLESTNTIVNDNIVIDATARGINVQEGSSATIFNNSASSATSDLVIVNDAQATVETNDLSSLQLSNGNGTTLINQPIGSYAITSAGFTILETGIGELRYLDVVSEVGDNLSQDIDIGVDYIDINSSGQPGLSTPANITFVNSTLTDPKIVRNGTQACPADVCQNLSYSNDVFIFNVTGFTNYSIQSNEVPEVTNIAPINNTIFTPQETVLIGADITDDIGIANVTANITNPSDVTVQINLSINDTNRWNGTFNQTSQLGTYQARIIATDVFGLINDTVFTFFISNDTQLPTITIISPTDGETITPGDVLNITINVTDNVGVDLVQANVTLPNGTTIPLNLTQDGDIYFDIFNQTDQEGTYTIIVIANDTGGLELTEQFTFQTPTTVTPTSSEGGGGGGLLSRPERPEPVEVPAVVEEFVRPPVDEMEEVIEPAIEEPAPPEFQPPVIEEEIPVKEFDGQFWWLNILWLLILLVILAIISEIVHRQTKKPDSQHPFRRASARIDKQLDTIKNKIMPPKIVKKKSETKITEEAWKVPWHIKAKLAFRRPFRGRISTTNKRLDAIESRLKELRS